MLTILLTAVGLLVVGDFLSTFVYHVPEHVWPEGKYHIQVHHSPNRSFLHYAVLSKEPRVLLDGFYGAVPYLLAAAAFALISWPGALLGLALGQFHVWWRHISALSWKTPVALQRALKVLCIVTPENHWIHHNNGELAFGDIFTFYEKPAHAWLQYLRTKKRAARR
jgi:hypothetical protein